MPELPEVQTIVNQLRERLVGRKITGLEVLMPKAFEGDKKDVVGEKITAVERRAKIILLSLSNGKTIAVHLKMTGQLIYGGDRGQGKGGRARHSAETISFTQGIPYAGFTLPSKTTRIIFILDNGARLFFNDTRMFGWVRVISNEQLAMINEKHGPEPFDSLALAQGKALSSEEFTPEYLRKILANWGRPVKLLLMEQSKIAGIGNIYANEALWCAEISPMKRGREVAKNKRKVKELFNCIQKVLEEGIKYGGTTAGDEAFANAKGEPGQMQHHLNVYAKAGQKCPRCGGTITRSTIGGRGTFFCPKCQN